MKSVLCYLAVVSCLPLPSAENSRNETKATGTTKFSTPFSIQNNLLHKTFLDSYCKDLFSKTRSYTVLRFTACSNHLLFTLLMKERFVPWGYVGGWTHDTWHWTGQMILAAVYQARVLTAEGTGCHATQSHMGAALQNRVDSQGLWEAGLEGQEDEVTLVPTGGCDWLVWIILQAGRELKLGTPGSAGSASGLL